MPSPFRPLLLAVASATLFAPAAGQGAPPRLWERLGTLPIDESSGVAVSRRFPGVLWTHNDSGDEPRLYAVRMDGTGIATYEVLGARAVDWEGMALGACPWQPARSCLVVGDIGDNAEQRTRVVLYFVEEPDPSDGSAGLRSIGPARALRVRYADRPHDAEGLAIAPDGTVSIVTKGRSGPVIRYTLAPETLLGDSATVLPADTLPLAPSMLSGRLVTGAAISPDGTMAAVRTYVDVRFFRIEDGRWTATGAECAFGLREPQGEAVDFLDESTLVFTSERAGGQPAIHRIRC